MAGEKTAQRFRKLPVVIDAIRWDGTNCEAVFAFLGIPHEPHDDEIDDIEIPTLEGVMTATLGDWIIRGVRGEHYPCKPDIFAATYEPAVVAVDGSGA